jgi:hypothetical protein
MGTAYRNFARAAAVASTCALVVAATLRGRDQVVTSGTFGAAWVVPEYEQATNHKLVTEFRRQWELRMPSDAPRSR